METLLEAYRFPNGFATQAQHMYGWLRHYNLAPSWGDFSTGESVIMLSASDLQCLRLMQKHDPARFSNAPADTPTREGQQ